MSSTASQSPTQYRGTTTSGSFYFCIEGVCALPRHVLLEPKLTLYTKLPKCYTWQDLKDLVRNEAAHGIWTEMASFANGQTGETGWCRVKRSEEARRLYSKFEMQRHRVAISTLQY
jgi:hypothetical protein